MHMKIQISIWLAIALICLGMCANAEKSGIDVLVRGQTAIMRIDKEWLQTYANQDVDPQSDSKIYHSEVINESMLKYHLESGRLCRKWLCHECNHIRSLYDRRSVY